MKKKIFIGLVIFLIILQFFPISTENPPYDTNEDFLALLGQSAPKEAELIKNACYDCHSHQTTFPTYTRFQPVGFFLRSHIRGGRQKLNFSTWSQYTEKQKIHKIQECVEVIEDKRMPMKSYTFLHPEAKLNDADKTLLIRFFNTLQ